MAVEKLAKVWPEWKVEKQLGRGSYGVVYKVVREDNNIKSHAAVKVISIPSDESELDSLRSEGLSEEGAKTYFQGIVNDFVGEIRLMESLKGVQNIVSVEDYKVVENTEGIGWDIYIRMELLTPFNTYICNKQMTESDVIKLGVDICTALEICGQRNIVHRDIKPENIFINDFGYYKLGDFGIARKLENASGGMSQKGTFNYMAPEVATGTSYDARVDICSLGIVLYRLLNGNRLPFLETEQQLQNPNERKNAVERRIRGEKMNPPCNASPQVAAVIMRACAYNPQARFANATEMKEALMRASIGAYVEQPSDMDVTVNVRSAGTNLNSTVYINPQGGNQTGANGYRQVSQNNGWNGTGGSGNFGNNTGNRNTGSFGNQSGNYNTGNYGNNTGNVNTNNFRINPNQTSGSGSVVSRTNGTNMGFGNNTMNQTGTLVAPATRKMSVLCLVSLLLSVLPFLADVVGFLLGAENLVVIYGVVLALTFVPLITALIGKIVASKKNQKGKFFALLAILVDIGLTWFYGDQFFTAYNDQFMNQPTVAAAIYIAYAVIFTTLSVVLYFSVGRKKS